MSSEAYEILSLAMRYVFAALGALIVLRAYRWLFKDHRAHKKEMKNLPDAGLVGEIVVLDSGKAFSLPREGTLGSARSCDICIRRPGVRRLHLTLHFVDGKGVRVTPHRGAAALLDGKDAGGYALHGSVIDLGNVQLRVRLFAGLHVPRLVPTKQEKFVSDDDEFVPDEVFDADELVPDDGFPDDRFATWQYAPVPPEMLEQYEDTQEVVEGDFDAFADPRYDGVNGWQGDEQDDEGRRGQ